ncbi:macro domain-containing protein [bacterium]|nr:macro domain-containing protein [bacterium]
MEFNIGHTKLSIIHGDIIESGVEAITNAANNKLWMGGGVAGAIKRAGGEEIETEAMKKGPAEIGNTIVTGSGSLSAKYVIHSVVMGQDLHTNAEYVKIATSNTLKTADEIPVLSLAMPAFGTGVGHFPAEECAEIMVDEIVNGLLNSKNLKLVKIVLKDKGAFEIFKTALENKFHKKR